MDYSFWLIVVGAVLLFGFFIYVAITSTDKYLAKVKEDTLETFTKEQLREMLAESLSVKPSQIKFTTGSDGGLSGFRVMKYGSPY